MYWPADSSTAHGSYAEAKAAAARRNWAGCSCLGLAACRQGFCRRSGLSVRRGRAPTSLIANLACSRSCRLNRAIEDFAKNYGHPLMAQRAAREVKNVNCQSESSTSRQSLVQTRRMWEGGPLRQWAGKRITSSWVRHRERSAGKYVCDDCGNRAPNGGVHATKESVLGKNAATQHPAFYGRGMCV